MADTTFVMRDAEGALRAFRAVDNGDGTYSLPVNVAFAGDIEIGAVELKDGATDVRAVINAANTARTTATVVQAVQVIGADGAVLPAVPILGAGEAHAGAIGGNSTVITMTPTLTVAATYVANDFVGTSSAAIVFANAARVSLGTGVVQSAILVDYALQSIATELWLFDAAPTPPVDSAAWSISDADALKCIGVITFNTYYASALNSVSNGSILNGLMGFKSTGTSLWGCLVTRGAPTYATGDLSIRLTILQD